MKSQPIDVDIILIHGTFSSTNGFPTQSLLRSKLNSVFDEKFIHCFGWSGENSHAARKQAKIELAEFLRTIRSNSIKIAIAHSHGGNLLVNNVDINQEYRQESPKVDVSITLGTPFIDATKHGFTISIWLSITSFAVSFLLLGSIAAVLAAFFRGFYVVETANGSDADNLKVVVLFAIAAIFPLYFFYYALCAAFNLSREYVEGVDNTLKDLEPKNTSDPARPANSFHLFDPWDEAYLWLSAHLKLANYACKCLWLLTWSVLAIGVLQLVGFVTSYALVGFDLSEIAAPYFDFTQTVFYYTCVAVAMAAIASISYLLFSELVLSRLWSFGALLPGSHFRWGLRVRRAPTSPNGKTLTLPCKRGAMRLKHCGYYDDELVVTSVMSIIESTLKKTV